jgi:NAD(P)H dehydrogenase (quinone)
MILVTGAGGKTGRAVVKALADKGASVRAFVHRDGHSVALQALGAAETVVGSFEDEAALLRAIDGTQAIYHICPNVSRGEVGYARAVASVAQANGVKRFIYHSVLHPQIEAMPHHWQKMRTEEMLFTFGFDLTVLQPTAYMQNILGAWPGIVRDGVFRVPYPIDVRLSLVDIDDVAEAAAIVLTQDGHIGATYELVGTPPLSQIDVAATISAALGREVRVEAESVIAWEARAHAGGMGDHERATLVAMFRCYAAHGLVGNNNMLSWLLRRAPTDLATCLARFAKLGAGA